MTGGAVTSRGWASSEQLAQLHSAFKTAFGDTLGMSAIALADIGNPDLCDTAACQAALDALLGQYVTHMQGHLTEPRFQALAARMGTLTPADWLTLAGLAYHKGAYGALSWLDHQAGQNPIAAAHAELDRYTGKQHKIVEALDALTTSKDKGALAAQPAHAAADSAYAAPVALSGVAGVGDKGQIGPEIASTVAGFESASSDFGAFEAAEASLADPKVQLTTNEHPLATPSGLVSDRDMETLYQALLARYGGEDRLGWSYAALLDAGELKRDKYEAALKSGKLSTEGGRKEFNQDTGNWNFDIIGVSAAPEGWTQRSFDSVARDKEAMSHNRILRIYDSQIAMWLTKSGYKTLAGRMGDLTPHDHLILACLAYHFGAKGVVDRLSKHQSDPMTWARQELNRISPNVSNAVTAIFEREQIIAGN